METRKRGPLEFVPAWILSLAALLLGLTLTVLDIGAIWSDEWAERIGGALIVAGLLGLMVEPFVRRNAMKEAAQGLFVHMLGFDLPDELREKLHEIVFKTRIILETVEIRCCLEQTGDGLMARIEWRDHVLNFSHGTEKYDHRAYFEVAENVTLEEMTLLCSNSKRSYTKKPELNKRKDEWICDAAAKRQKIKPRKHGETYVFLTSYRQPFRETDVFPIHIGYPALRVTLHLEVPDGFEMNATPATSQVGDDWLYERLFMPDDVLYLRWRPKSPGGSKPP